MSTCEKKLSEIQLTRRGIDILQVNLGMVCNQACTHCHYNAGPSRTESMSAETCRKVLDFFTLSNIPTIELTGGAPELNPNFKDIVRRARSVNRDIVVRSNLTVLFEDGMEGLAQFLASNRVELVCSLPCYLEENVDGQRGRGVYEKSIAALKMLNKLGYGLEGTGLMLYLVYNPAGPFLPGDQIALEGAYRQNLQDMHGIKFSHLYAITNMPLGRFEQKLKTSGAYDDYKTLLKSSSNIGLLANAMCRNLASIGWDGRVYDCDFNQALSMPINNSRKLWEFTLEELLDKDIKLADHCYGCIAGSGSSCTGILDRG